MRYIFLILTIISLSTFSCGNYLENNGYPKSVSFPADGGTEIISGEKSLFNFIIDDGNKEYTDSFSETDSTFIVEAHWLKITTKYNSHYITLEAASTDIKGPETLWIYANSGPEEAVIKVTRN